MSEERNYPNARGLTYSHCYSSLHFGCHCQCIYLCLVYHGGNSQRDQSAPTFRKSRVYVGLSSYQGLAMLQALDQMKKKNLHALVKEAHQWKMVAVATHLLFMH